MGFIDIQYPLEEVEHAVRSAILRAIWQGFCSAAIFPPLSELPVAAVDPELARTVERLEPLRREPFIIESVDIPSLMDLDLGPGVRSVLIDAEWPGSGGAELVREIALAPTLRAGFTPIARIVVTRVVGRAVIELRLATLSTLSATGHGERPRTTSLFIECSFVLLPSSTENGLRISLAARPEFRVGSVFPGPRFPLVELPLPALLGLSFQAIAGVIQREAVIPELGLPSGAAATMPGGRDRIQELLGSFTKVNDGLEVIRSQNLRGRRLVVRLQLERGFPIDPSALRRTPTALELERYFSEAERRGLVRVREEWERFHGVRQPDRTGGTGAQRFGVFFSALLLRDLAIDSVMRSFRGRTDVALVTLPQAWWLPGSSTGPLQVRFVAASHFTLCTVNADIALGFRFDPIYPPPPDVRVGLGITMTRDAVPHTGDVVACIVRGALLGALLGAGVGAGAGALGGVGLAAGLGVIAEGAVAFGAAIGAIAGAILGSYLTVRDLQSGSDVVPADFEMLGPNTFRSVVWFEPPGTPRVATLGGMERRGLLDDEPGGLLLAFVGSALGPRAMVAPEVPALNAGLSGGFQWEADRSCVIARAGVSITARNSGAWPVQVCPPRLVGAPPELARALALLPAAASNAAVQIVPGRSFAWRIGLAAGDRDRVGDAELRVVVSSAVGSTVLVSTQPTAELTERASELAREVCRIDARQRATVGGGPRPGPAPARLAGSSAAGLALSEALVLGRETWPGPRRADRVVDGSQALLGGGTATDHGSDLGALRALLVMRTVDRGG